MKLYYTPGACSVADHIALAEAGLPYDLVKVDLQAKKTESGDDYLKVNPKGYVPALALDEGEVLTENIAILSYIADKSGKLMPSGSSAKWRVLEALSFISTELHKSFKPFFAPNSTDEDKKAATEMLNKRFAIVEAQLGSGGGFLFGSEMSIADCYLWTILSWAMHVHLPISQKLSEYFQRLAQRPAIQRILKEEGLA